jgi:hypothetical protein
MRRLMATAAALAVIAPGVSRAAEPPCLTPSELTSLAGYSLPSIITGTSERCASVLGADAYLPRNGAQLAARYAERRAADWPGAKSAFLKFSTVIGADANRTIQQMPDASLQPILDTFIEGMVSQQIPLKRCNSIDRLVRLLAPLPPDKTAELIAIAVGLESKAGERKFGKFSICPA